MAGKKENKSQGGSSGSGGDRDGGENLVDLQRRKIALEIEREIGGLFGIDLHDIEMALDRIEERGLDPSSGSTTKEYRIPDPLFRTIRFLEIILDMARESKGNGDPEMVRRILESVEHYRDRLEALLEG